MPVSLRPLKVATPFTSVGAVELPERVEPELSTVMVAELLVTTLPEMS